MQISRKPDCECGADLRQTRSDPTAITTVEEGSRRFNLFHCPACGTLFVAVDEGTPYPRPVGAET